LTIVLFAYSSKTERLFLLARHTQSTYPVARLPKIGDRRLNFSVRWRQIFLIGSF